jgi:predicted dehydrogenase
MRREATTNRDGEEGISRREFVGRTVAGVAAGLIAGACAGPPVASRKRPGPNDRVVLGLIGCGGMGAANMRHLMAFDDVEVAALCDVDDDRVPADFKDVEAKYGKAPTVYKDYRRLLDRQDVDAVIVGTPDHWHALNLIHAVEAGKDAYCEKPISHDIVEARSMAAAAKYHRSVVQVGTWQRSTREFNDAIAYVRSGKLGRITQCRAWITDTMRIGKGKGGPAPKNLDYDFWVGPAAMTPYQANKLHLNWRWVMNTGGGMSTDWGVHMIDIALLGMSAGQDLVMPTDVTACGGQYALLDDDRDAPDVTEALLRFKDPDFVLHWSILRDHPGKPDHGTEFVAADGRTLRVWRGGWSVLDPDGNELPKEQADPLPTDHWRNFVDCVKSRAVPRADLASVAQTTIACHLVNASLQAGETVRWDQAKSDLVGRAGRQTLAWSRHYRKPWQLPDYA